MTKFNVGDRVSMAKSLLEWNFSTSNWEMYTYQGETSENYDVIVQLSLMSAIGVPVDGVIISLGAEDDDGVPFLGVAWDQADLQYFEYVNSKDLRLCKS